MILANWISEGVVFKFWGDNVDKQRCVRDYRSDHHGAMVHMYSILAGRSCTPAKDLLQTGQLSNLTGISADMFLPQQKKREHLKFKGQFKENVAELAGISLEDIINDE